MRDKPEEDVRTQHPFKNIPQDDRLVVVGKDEILDGQSLGAPVSGVYTPVASDLINASSVTPSEFHYSRSGDEVSVSGLLTVDPTDAGALQYNLTLPIASNLSNGTQLAGVGAGALGGSTVQPATITGNSALDLAVVTTNSGGTSVGQMTVAFMYRVL